MNLTKETKLEPKFVTKAWQRTCRFTWPFPNLPWISTMVTTDSWPRSIWRNSYESALMYAFGHQAPPADSVRILEWENDMCAVLLHLDYVMWMSICKHLEMRNDHSVKRLFLILDWVCKGRVLSKTREFIHWH